MNNLITKTLLFSALLSACNSGDSTEKQAIGEPHAQIIFPLQKEHVHGPTVVELPSGDLLSAWFQGSGERWADDVRIMGARKHQKDTVWSEPFLMADVPAFPDINPMMFLDQDQKLWLMFYTVIANQWETSLPRYMISSDYNGEGGPKWEWQEILLGKPGDLTERGIQPGDKFVESVQDQLQEYDVYLKQEILEQIPADRKEEYLTWWKGYQRRIDSLARGENMIRGGRLRAENDRDTVLGYPLMRRIGWQTKNKPYLEGDRILVPFYSDGLDCSIFAFTDNRGKTWEWSNPVVGGIGIQPTIARKSNGDLAAYMRDNGPPPQRMQITTSNDRGATWSIAKDAELPNPGAGFDMVTLENGNWLIVYNDTEDGRHNLAVSLSEDDGSSWPFKKYLENDNRGEDATASHYPAIVQGADGLIHVIYSYHHKDRPGEPHKTIKYAVFAEDWVRK